MSESSIELVSAKKLAWYMRGLWSYFISTGIQSVLVPSLLTFMLHVSSDELGIAQMLSMLPMLLLSLFGGAAADRAELRRHLMRLQLLSVLPPLMLAIVILTDNLSYGFILAYAVMMSSLGGFVMPARDSLLSRVAMMRQGGNIQKAVALAMAGQFLGQVGGFMLGGTAEYFGAHLLLVVQSGLLAFAALTTSRLDPAPPMHVSTARRSPLKEVKAGLLAIWESDRIRPVLIFQFFGGVLFMGIFMVLFPILIRDVYNGESFEIGLLLMSFFSGIGIASFTVSRFGDIRHQGRTIMLTSGISVSVMLLIHLQPPVWMLCLLAMIWGLGGGVSMTISRSIVQETATDDMRARMLAGFTLGTMGGGPIGSFLTGYAIHWLGPLNAVLLPCGLMVVLWLSIFFFTPLWHMEAPRHVPEGRHD